MALKHTIDKMKETLLEMSFNLEKVVRGNKAAAQRVRKQTIEFAKIAKLFRKESIAEAKSGKLGKAGRRSAPKMKRKATTRRKKVSKR